jgi:hypothetical protein
MEYGMGKMKEIIKANGNLYQLVRVLEENKLKNPDMNILKEYFRCDTLLRKQGTLYFCRLIEEINYEEIAN